MFANWKIALKRFIRLKQEKYNRHKEGKSPTPVSSLVPHATHAALSYAIYNCVSRSATGPHTNSLFRLTYLLFSSNSAIANLFCLTQTKISLGPTFHEVMCDYKSSVTLLTTFDSTTGLFFQQAAI